MAVTAAATGTASAGPATAAGLVLPSPALYVGDLEKTVDEGRLFELFNQVAPVASVRVCRDQTHRSLGYAYVNFNNAFDAASAKDVLNFTPINGKSVRIMFCQRDPSLRKSGYANLFIKNLDPSIDHKALFETFSAFGTVVSCKVAVDEGEKSKGYGFVQFDKEESAQAAIKRLNGMLINDKKVYVGTFIRGQERNLNKGSPPPLPPQPTFTNVYVKNLSEGSTEDDLRDMFGKYGSITSAAVMRDSSGKSRCFGFVNFESSDSAAAAVENMNGYSLDDNKVLYVGKAEKKAERQADLRAKFEQERNSMYEKLKGSNLYLKNLDEGVDDEKLKELFSEFGTITSCKVMRDPKGESKGAGFVAFSSGEEANKALNDMNGKMIGRKPLYVAVAQKKEERKAWLQAYFAQMRTTGALAAPFPGRIGFQAAVPPGLAAHQQLYFGQVGPGIIPQPPPAAYGFEQPGLQQAVPHNFILPFQIQRPQGQQHRLGSRRAVPQQHNNQQFSKSIRWFLQRNSNEIVSRRNGVSPSIVVTQSVTGSVAPELPISSSISLSKATLASALASASPESQRVMLGEQLYPLVEQIERSNARKVTGMLLEMDQTEVLHLIESPDALKKKVGEAMDVLRIAASQPRITEQL
ncbi:hypothetical protein M569_03039, partial [Genlisea aurea]